MGDHREPGKISDVTHGREEGHGILTARIGIDFGGGCHQGFGNLCLTKESLKHFLHDLCLTFGVREPEQLVGKECLALRSFSGWNEPIEGLETPDGKRFTLTGFRKKYYPEHAKSQLANRKESLESDIQHWKRRIRENEQELKTIDKDFVDWEKEKR